MRPGRPVATWLAVVAASGLVTLFTAVPGRGAATEPATDAGREVFAANCAVCHGPDAQGMGMAPALGGAVDRLGRAGVEVTVRRGRNAMPAFEGRLTDEEIVAVVAYIETLPVTSRRGHMMGDGMGPWMMWPGAGWLAFTLLVALLFGLLGGVVGYFLGRAR